MAKRTKEEIKAWRERMTVLSRKVKAMSENEKGELFARLGTLTAEGRALSVYNSVMLYYQSGRMLSQVGGYKQWQKVGRMVRKGERSIGSIWVPIGNVAEGDELKFISVPVFDLSQTESMEL